MKKNVVVIGSGFAGLSAACFMAKAGWAVTLVEKQSTPGGRARQLKTQGFTFDMGPSWYWMPEVFERFFECFGKKTTDYYQLKRLEPSYRIYWEDEPMDIPANYEELKALFEKTEVGAANKLDTFLKEAEFKYNIGINKLVHKPGQSYSEFLDIDLIKGVFKLDVFTSIRKHIFKLFKHPKLRQLLEFPVLFLGALPQDTPALYSLMNYADIKLGTWHPIGGMYAVVNAMYSLAKELGVNFYFGHNVTKIETKNSVATAVVATTENNEQKIFEADVIIGGADYNFIETKLLAKENQSYSEKYWEKKLMAPSCLLYYVGINKKLDGILHHTLFFDTDFEIHGKEIYTTKQWPTEPSFYVSAPTVTEPEAAPNGYETLFFLIPIAAGLEGDTDELKDKYFQKIVKRFEDKTGYSISDSIVYKKCIGVSDFKADYNSFKGNAYGLANTLMQTAVLKPSCRSLKIKNLFYTGQLTVPGPGVPPCLISGEVVSKEVVKYFG
ncbi:MAG: phytoene desaturase family protein [Ferruginibacter sp.]|nr:phytoene desaturase [Ferruginibacter sp.]